MDSPNMNQLLTFPYPLSLLDSSPSMPLPLPDSSPCPSL